MKNKIFYLSIIAALAIFILPDINTFADTTVNPDNYSVIVYGYSTQLSGYIMVCSNNRNGQLYLYQSGNTIYLSNVNNNLDLPPFMKYYATPGSMNITPGYNSSYFNVDHYIVYKGTVVTNGITTNNESFSSWDDYLDYISPHYWYDDFVDWWDDKLYNLSEGIVDIWDWVKSFFIDDPEELPDINDIIVTPAPTPTPIPYEVQIRTDPVTNNTSIVYVYNDTNNNTVVSNEPPAPYNPLPVTIGTGLGTGNGSDSGPQYYTNTDPIGLPDLDWLNFDLDFDGNIISTLTGFGSGIETINASTSEYSSGIENIFSIFLQIPQDIYFVIGIALSIILIAGIISRFLS